MSGKRLKSFLVDHVGSYEDDFYHCAKRIVAIDW